MANVKIALSVKQPVFEKMEEIAQQRKVSRSQVYSEAAEQYLHRLEAEQVGKTWDAVYAEEPTEEDKAVLAGMWRLHQKTLEPEQW